ncbi:MAG: hypothetical protein O7G85_17305 [Planctomycetota bacterium]|nr:hypothetical protein [Planctomycetota bacterium]
MIVHSSRMVRAGLLGGLLLLGGCFSSKSSSPTKVTSSRAFNLTGQSPRPVIVLGLFENPRHSPLPWRDIGEGMTDALSREVRSQGVYDAWINARIGRELNSILLASPADRPRRFEKLEAKHPDIRYILVGQVTDFQHIGESARNTRSAEAIVAIDFSIIDIQERRTILSDHVMAMVDASGTESNELYGDMVFGSYRYWDTPLGRASQRTILEVIRRIDEVPIPEESLIATTQVELEEAEPAEVTSPPVHVTTTNAPDPLRHAIRIDKQINPRRIRVVAGRGRVLHEGQTLYVCQYDPDRGQLVAVQDRDTGRPLQAKIIKVRFDVGTALLLGLKPATISLRGAVLTERRAPMPETEVATHSAGMGAADIPRR